MTDIEFDIKNITKEINLQPDLKSPETECLKIDLELKKIPYKTDDIENNSPYMSSSNYPTLYMNGIKIYEDILISYNERIFCNCDEDCDDNWNEIINVYVNIYAVKPSENMFEFYDDYYGKKPTNLLNCKNISLNEWSNENFTMLQTWRDKGYNFFVFNNPDGKPTKNYW
jgi:hypothetical protein